MKLTSHLVFAPLSIVLAICLVGCQPQPPRVHQLVELTTADATPEPLDPGLIVLDPARVLHPVPAVRGVMTEWMVTSRRADPASVRPRGVERGYGTILDLTEEDIALAASIGVNTIRCSVGHTALEDRDTPGKWNETGFARLRELLDWYAKYDIQAIIDLHNALGREGGGDPRLWRQTEFQDRFVNVWREIAKRFKDHPQVIAYEPLNEPEPRHVPDMSERHAVWNNLAARVCRAIREVDPEKPIIIDCIEYANPAAFAGLKPINLKNIVYSFHWYAPSKFHSQKRPWTTDKETYHYPGVFDGEQWNRDRILGAWRQAINFAGQHNVPLFSGEFGCVSDTPEMEDMVWLLDVISLFDQNNIGWTYYHYMFRTVEPYWMEHFDCNLFIYEIPNQRLRPFDRKVSLMSDLFKLRGNVLKHAQPVDADLTVYAVATPDGQLRAYVSNKSREQAKTLTLNVGGGPWARQVSVQRMAKGTGGYVPAEPVTVQNRQIVLELEPLTILRLTIRPESEFRAGP